VKSLFDKIAYLSQTSDNSAISDLNLFDPVDAYLLLAMNWHKFKESSDKLLFSETKRIYDALLLNERDIVSIILIGSVARGCQNSSSDLDIVVIYNNKKIDLRKYGSSYKEANILSWSKSEFELKYKKGIELFLWCVNYGLLLFDRNYFMKYYSKPNILIRKNEISTKRTLINSLQIKIYEAIAIGDLVLAVKLINNMSIQIARIILISKDIIPKSRPELISQLKEINSSFGDILVTNIKLDEMNNKELVEYTDKIYVKLDAYLNDFYSGINHLN